MEPSRYTVLCLPCSSQSECSAVSARLGSADAQKMSASAKSFRMRSARCGVAHGQRLQPADLGVDAAIIMQVETAICRRPRIDGITIALRQELGAGRRRPQQAHAVALAVVLLVNVAPHDS